MPDLISLFRQRNAAQFAATFAVEQAELDSFCMLGKQRKVHALAIPGRTQGVGFSGPHHRFPGNQHNRALNATSDVS